MSDPFAPADEHLSTAPLPTAQTLRRRKSLPLQLWRFAVLNLKIIRMVLKGHQ